MCHHAKVIPHKHVPAKAGILCASPCDPTLKLSASGFYAQFRINVSCVASSVSSASRSTAHITPNTRDRCWLIRSANALSSPPQALSTRVLSPGNELFIRVLQYARSYNRFSFWHKVHEFSQLTFLYDQVFIFGHHCIKIGHFIRR